MDDEIKLVYNVITHPAGFLLDLFGESLYIRSTKHEFEIGWETVLDGQVCNSHKLFWDALVAATFFVNKRYELKIGIDFEGK